MPANIPVYQAQVTDDYDNGIFAMSFVDFPAVERNFVMMKNRAAVKVKLNRQKQILTGVVLIPDQLIYRNQAPLGEYYMKFTAADIERIAQKMMKTGISLSTTTHQHERKLDGNYLVELWTVNDPKLDKSVSIGLGELPKGTLCASYKIEDSEYWKKEVLTGNVKGFSLEGFFNLNNVTIMTKQKTAAAKAPAKKAGPVASFLKSIAAMLEGETAAEADALADVAADDTTDSGDPFLIFELSEGGELFVDSEGFATINDEQAPAGQHALSDGNFIVIDDAGNMVVTEEEADVNEPTEAELAKVQEAKDRAKQFLAKAPAKAAAPGKAPAKAAAPAAVVAKPGTPAARIAALEAEIATLKKQPTVAKAKPKTDEAKAEPVNFTERVAAALSARLDRKSK